MTRKYHRKMFPSFLTTQPEKNKMKSLVYFDYENARANISSAVRANCAFLPRLRLSYLLLPCRQW